MEIKGRQVLKIKTISSNNPYKVENDSKLYGQFYNVYQLDGKVFNVNTKDEFVQWRDSGLLFSADFAESSYEREVDGKIETIQSLRLVTCTNTKQEIAMAQCEAMLTKIYRDVEVTEVSDDVLSAFNLTEIPS
jgi:hypothetical protein